MRIEDLAEQIGDEHGMNQAFAEAALIELLDELVAGGGHNLTDFVDPDDIAEIEVPVRTQRRLRQLFADQQDTTTGQENRDDG